jgi:type II secretory pathway component GspD/PulD (secretin)
MTSRSQNLAWTVKNGVVVLGNKSQAAGTITNEIYPVKDLTFKQTSFLPPTILEIPGEGTSDTPRTGGEGEDPVPGIESADLVTLLQGATDPAYWSTEGVAMQVEESGLLVVKASPEMQAKVAAVLRDMRRFQTPIVTIDSKFLTISRNFLQEVGIDFRGLGGSSTRAASSISTTSPTASSTTAPAVRTTAAPATPRPTLRPARSSTTAATATCARAPRTTSRTTSVAC